MFLREDGFFEGHVAGAFLEGAEDFGVGFVEAADVEFGLEESAFVDADGAGVDFAFEEAAFEDAQGAVAVDAGGDFAADDHVVDADGVGDDDVGAFFDADAAGADLAVEASGGADAGLAVAENFAGRAAADVGLAADGELVVEVAEFFDGEGAAGADDAADALLDENVIDVDVRVAVRAGGGGGEVRDFVDAAAFVAADAFEFRRAPALVVFAQFVDLRFVAQDPGLGDFQDARGERRELGGEGREFLPPRGHGGRERGEARRFLVSQLEVLPAGTAERADDPGRFLLGGAALRTGDRLFRGAGRHGGSAFLEEAFFGFAGRRGTAAGARLGAREAGFVRADFGFSDEGGAVFDDDAAGAEVADELGGGFEFDAFGGVDVALHGAVDDDGFGFHFTLHVGAFADGEGGVGGDFALDFAVENEVVLEFECAFDFHVA